MFESKEIKSSMATYMNNFHVSEKFAKKCAIITVKFSKDEISFKEYERQQNELSRAYPEEASKFRRS
jgi:hypothetical protein